MDRPGNGCHRNIYSSPLCQQTKPRDPQHHKKPMGQELEKNLEARDEELISYEIVMQRRPLHPKLGGTKTHSISLQYEKFQPLF